MRDVVSHNLQPLLRITIVLACSLWAPPLLAQSTTRVSVSSSGSEGDSHSYQPVISADGRFVAFESIARNLVPGDTNDNRDIFVRDRQTGQTTRVSVSSSGSQGNADSTAPAISANGRFVTFHTLASNLVSGDTNGDRDIFVHDRQAGLTTRVSVSSSGSESDSHSYRAAISSDGRFVAFESNARNLVLGGTNGGLDVFVHDRHTGQTTHVSVSSSGSQGNADSYLAAISANGRFVAFESFASNLVPGDTNGNRDIFIHDRQTGQTSRVSVSSSGSQGNADSYQPTVSSEGRFVAFESDASNLVPGDTNGDRDIFVHDRQTGQTARVSVSSSGSQANNWSYSPAISAEGRFVAFDSFASDLVPGDTNGDLDVFVHDRQTAQTSRVSVSSSGSQGNASSFNVAISAAGRFVAFRSWAGNLVLGDTNGQTDIFIHDRGVVESIPQPPEPEPPFNPAEDPEVRNLVFITHGINTDEAEWEAVWEPLVDEVQGYINAWVPNADEWEVAGHWWGDYELSNGLNTALQRGEAHGAVLANMNLDHIHFIAHSAGSGFISRAAEMLGSSNRGSPAPTIHSTYLDAYAGLSFQHRDLYGADSDWAEHYVAWDVLTREFTNLRLPHAHNVDVTQLDPCSTFGAISDHGWPREFYRWTLTTETPQLTCSDPPPMPSLDCTEDYGWPLSAAYYQALSEQWPAQMLETVYPRGERVELTCDGSRSLPRGDASEPQYATRLDEPIDFEPLANSVSITGSQVVAGGLNLDAQASASHGPDGNAAWLITTLELSEPVNFIRFDAGFDSPAPAQGVLTIFVGAQSYATDERYARDGLTSHIFDLPEEIGPGLVNIGFRLDAFGPERSHAQVRNVPTGFGGILPGPFAIVAPQDGEATQTLTPVLEWEESPHARAYTARVATDPQMKNILFDLVSETPSFHTSLSMFDGQDVYYWTVTAYNPLGSELAEPGVISFTTPLFGDATADGVVDFSDLVTVLVEFGLSGEGLEGDVDGDGDVDFSDLGVILTFFGATAP